MADIPNGVRGQPRTYFGEEVDIRIATQPDGFWTVSDERSAEQVLVDIGLIWEGQPTAYDRSLENSPNLTEGSGTSSRQAAGVVDADEKDAKKSAGSKTAKQKAAATKQKHPRTAQNPSKPPKTAKSLVTDEVEVHSDEPTAEDQLGRLPFAWALVDRIEDIRKKGGKDGFASCSCSMRHGARARRPFSI